MAFGVTNSGFSRPRLIDIQQGLNSSIKTKFGAGANTSAANSVFTNLVGIMSEQLDELWQAGQADYDASYPDTSFGASLDNVGAISGIPRLGPLASVATSVKIFGTSGTLIPAGTQYSVEGSPTSVFSQNADATLVAGQSCVQILTFSAVPTAGTYTLGLGSTQTDPIAAGASAADIQAAIRARLEFASGTLVTGTLPNFTVTFAGPGTGGFMIQPQISITTSGLVDVSSNPVIIVAAITTPGIDQAVVSATATATGPTVADAGSLTVIVNPLAGLTAVLNTLDATVGRAAETDNAYRARRAQELQIAGAGTVEAIRAKLFQVAGVTAVIVFENATDIPDLDGRPPHSFEAVVQGGDDQDIRDMLWAVKPAGIATDGSVDGTIIDSQGQTHDIKFSRPTDLDLYVIIQLSVDDTYPANGDVVAKQSVIDAGNSLGIGKEVIVVPKLISVLAPIQGIQDATILIGTSPSPSSSANVPVGANEIAVFDTTRTSVVHV